MLILWTLSVFYFFKLSCSSEMQLFQWVESDDVSTEQEMVVKSLASGLN